ncbi:MAG: BT_3928 family protein [Cyclobacteriaceae bacterium]
MKAFDNGIRYFVGAFFIFSGLIKVNDPVGTSIKLKEYFQVFSDDFGSFFEVFIPFSLELAVFIVVLEVILGFTTILAYRMNINSWILLLLIIFFTFLTFYSAAFDKVTDCGCFGDAIPLTPFESFIKDLVLLALIIYIFIKRKTYKPLLKHPISDYVVMGITIVMLALAIYAIQHLPYIDFRPYNVGASIPDNMQPSAEYQYQYIMKKDGKKYKFDVYPADTTYEFVEMKLLNPEAQPKITDYSVWNEEGDFTEESFRGEKLLVIVENIVKADQDVFQEINQLAEKLQEKVELMILTANDERTFETYRHEYQLAIDYYYADHTVLEAMIRSNPGLMLLKDGIVLGKWHHNDIPSDEKILEILNNSTP